MPRETGATDPGCVAVVGATGAVGREVLGLLAARGVPAARIRALASARSAGSSVEFGALNLSVGAIDERSFDGCSLAIFAADAATARRYAPVAVGAGAVVIDNSSAFRLDPAVPLVVPEVNPGGVRLADDSAIIANPNCTTIILVTALEPLRRAFGVEAVDIATYQAVSGAGLAAIDELLADTRASLDPDAARPTANGQRVFAEPAAFNVFSHDSPVDPLSGLNGEEQKVIDETRKIWNDPAIRVTPTCVRVPVVRAHTEAVTVTLATPADEAGVRAAFREGTGVEIVDDRAANSFPTPRKASGRAPVLVGRLRPDPGEAPDAEGRNRRWCLLACGDQLLKGAALNAVQIAEGLGLVPTSPPPAALSARPREVSVRDGAAAIGL
ncbi:MAG: aspartate-semialdehyde dehydrogenase [Phycisphaerales bacterium JB041]